MYQAAITSKGQLTIPKEIRKLLGVDRGNRVLFSVDPDGRVVMSSPLTLDQVRARFRVTGREGLSVDDMETAVSTLLAGEERRVRE